MSRYKIWEQQGLFKRKKPCTKICKAFFRNGEIPIRYFFIFIHPAYPIESEGHRKQPSAIECW